MMNQKKKILTSRTLRRGAPLTVQKQWGGEGGSGLLEPLDGLLLAGTDQQPSSTPADVPRAILL